MKPAGLARSDIAAIRRLDVKWAMDRALGDGISLEAAPSLSAGRVLEPEEIALMALHQVRVICGTTAQARKSKNWLSKNGHPILFESFTKGGAQ